MSGRRRSRLSLERIIERMAALTAPRHRDLVRAMRSELASIDDPAERRRFALGALAALTRLALSRVRGTLSHTPGRFAGIPEPADNAHPGGLPMPELSTRQLLRRLLTPFAVTFLTLTAILLTRFAARLLPQLNARGEPPGTLIEALLLALPAIVALTIPMAVFISVTWVFTRLGRDGVLVLATREAHGIRRLIGPVLGTAAVFAALTFVSNSEVLPRANGRFAALMAEGPVARSDRSMTLGELREAARSVLADARPDAAERATAYEVEIQKKGALAAACLFLALAGVAIPLRFPRGGTGLVIAASVGVFTGYYLLLVTGEALADQRVIPPSVAMWMANALLLAVVMLLVWRPGASGGPRNETLATAA